eukprot:GHUV01053929.1.p1 GENE.GHUV01053929.1~~GHUV01053929.1.p1  ORF type:complete len:134 (+),score=30.85 GHUV01053929.1:38-439(+)
MPLAIEEYFLKHNPSKTLVVGVAIDGSNLSDRALETACQFYNEKRKDKLVILHVADSKKTFLPKNLQPKQLERQYVDKAFGMHVRDRFETSPGLACHPSQVSKLCTAIHQQRLSAGPRAQWAPLYAVDTHVAP